MDSDRDPARLPDGRFKRNYENRSFRAFGPALFGLRIRLSLGLVHVPRHAVWQIHGAPNDGAPYARCARRRRLVDSRRARPRRRLSETNTFHGLDKRFLGAIPVMVGTGILLYMLSATSYYVYLAVLASREAEARAIVAQVLARDAELRALKAQVNPHFLFNSLNSISALTTSDAPKAREMCILLGDFLRRTLGLGEKLAIPLEEEMSLIHAYLAVEKIRFGARLRMEENIEKDALGIEVPPLLLQPLVENAVAHGIANLVEGGWIRLNVARQNGQLFIVVENQFDPEAPARRRNGVGLVNVRQRLETRYGKRASFDVKADGGSFRVTIAIPTETEVPST